MIFLSIRHLFLTVGRRLDGHGAACAQTGATPLYMSAWKGHVDAFALLMQAGANVDAPFKVGNTQCRLI